MVIKKDPRAILDMLSKPVDIDEDEFLDKLDKDKSFALMPDKPPESLDVNPLVNQEQADMLGSLADEEVDEEDLGDAIAVPAASNAPVNLTKKEQRFFSLFQGTSSKEENQAAVPEGVKLAAVHASEQESLLPKVGETQAEREAKEEDLARRQAYIEIYAKEQEKQDATQKKAHDKFVGIFRDVNETKWKAMCHFHFVVKNENWGGNSVGAYVLLYYTIAW